ncbi:hypothetical protein [Bradyrhizobium sp. Gha]|uniref:hypothetical protein n=1 Tax=Bradyrhizobium sp. Gha TaxID=1855318 RepID=UPI0008EC772E|nr:hypothetical protein [Bradyrhizobium sp. Gha]SFJ53368.1 hypothetical protein SAMN05216525_12797 [Bradyrhizobium sp. Gha]
MNEIIDRARETLDRLGDIEADMIARRERRALHGDGEMWRVPEERNNVRKQNTSRLIIKTREDALVETPEPHQVDRAELMDFADAVGETTGKLEKMIRQAGTAQDEALGALRDEMVALIEDVRADLQGQLDALESDLLDRGANVTALKRRANVKT